MFLKFLLVFFLDGSGYWDPFFQLYRYAFLDDFAVFLSKGLP